MEFYVFHRILRLWLYVNAVIVKTKKTKQNKNIELFWEMEGFFKR